MIWGSRFSLGDSDLLFHCRFDAEAVEKAVQPETARGDNRVISFSNCAVAEGKEGYGIRIGSENQPGFIRYPAVRNLDPQRGTIEFWVRLNWDCTEATSRLKRVFFDTGTSSSRNRIFIHFFDYTFRFGIFDSAGGFHFVDSSSFPDWKAGQWHHVACGWDLAKKQMLIRVDDQIESARPSNPDAGDWKLNLNRDSVNVIFEGISENILLEFNGLGDTAINLNSLDNAVVHFRNVNFSVQAHSRFLYAVNSFLSKVIFENCSCSDLKQACFDINALGELVFKNCRFVSQKK